MTHFPSLDFLKFPTCNSIPANIASNTTWYIQSFTRSSTYVLTRLASPSPSLWPMYLSQPIHHLIHLFLLILCIHYDIQIRPIQIIYYTHTSLCITPGSQLLLFPIILMYSSQHNLLFMWFHFTGSQSSDSRLHHNEPIFTENFPKPSIPSQPRKTTTSALAVGGKPRATNRCISFGNSRILHWTSERQIFPSYHVTSPTWSSLYEPLLFHKFSPQNCHTNGARSIKFPKLSNLDRHRQALHPKTQNWVKMPCATWRSGMYRQAVPLIGTQKHQNQRGRMVVMHSPPSGFWNFSRNTIVHAETHNIHTIHTTYHAIMHPEYQ